MSLLHGGGLLRRAVALIIIFISLGLASCGGGVTPLKPAVSIKRSVVFQTLASVPDTSCGQRGGVTVMSGVDTNGNGVLDAAEVTNTQFVCSVTAGTTLLVSSIAEPAGANCTYGGNKVTAWFDTNSNKILDAGEPSSTTYICNGVIGINGLNSLLNVIPELEGTNCGSVGSKIVSGVDTNANQVLDPSEITNTVYVCNGSGLATGRVTDGRVWGAKVTLDTNDDRICDASEPSVTTDSTGGFFFDPALGSHMLCASGGTDMATLKPFQGYLTAPAGATQITPLTTLVVAAVNASLSAPAYNVYSPMPTVPANVISPPLDIATANTTFATALVLPGINLLTTDPAASSSPGVLSNPGLLSKAAAIEVLLEQIAATVGVASGKTGVDPALYAAAVNGLSATLRALPPSPALDFSIQSTVSPLVDGTIDSMLTSLPALGLSAVNVKALTSVSLSGLGVIVGASQTANFAVAGGAADLANGVAATSRSLMNLVEANRSSLSASCTTCAAPLGTVATVATTLLNTMNVTPLPENTVVLDISTVAVGGVHVNAPTSNANIYTVKAPAGWTTASIAIHSSPTATTTTVFDTFVSAGITMTNSSGTQLQIVIDKIQYSVLIAGADPVLAIPATGTTVYTYVSKAGVVTKAQFSNVGPLISMDPINLSVVNIDMAGLLALNAGVAGDFTASGQYKVSFGLSGAPVRISDGSVTNGVARVLLPVIEDASKTGYIDPAGPFITLGTDFLVIVSP